MSAVTPYYYKFDFEEIKQYYETIIHSVDNRMIIYSIPALTGISMTLEQFEELLRHEKIIGVKFTSTDFFLLERLRRSFPAKLIYAGFDEMLLSAVVLNVDGAIGSTYNINGRIAKKIFALVHEGNIQEARLLQHKVNDFIQSLLENGLYQTIKEILKTQGVEAGYCMPPLKRLSGSVKYFV